MKEFKVNRSSWHYKLNQHFLNEDGVTQYSMERFWEPKVNNFCAYWRATIVRLVAATTSLSIAIAAVVGISILSIQNPWKAFSVVSVIIAILAALFSFFMFFVGLGKAKKVFNNSDSLIVTKIKTYKAKICPNVTYGK
jgi:hypothetical protein